MFLHVQISRLGSRETLVVPFAIDARAFEELFPIVDL
jgi:hypothetical protein